MTIYQFDECRMEYTHAHISPKIKSEAAFYCGGGEVGMYSRRASSEVYKRAGIFGLRKLVEAEGRKMDIDTSFWRL